MGFDSDLSKRVNAFVTSLVAPRWRMTAGVIVALIAAVAAANGGCSSSTTNPIGTPTPSPSPSVSPTPTGATPTPPPQNFVSMTYVGATPTTDPTYGQVDGYGLLAAAPTSTPATTPAPSQIITVTHGQTIAFLNFDNQAHTASLLTPATGAACSSFPSSPCFPPTFNNVNGASTSSPLLTPISSAQFSTGNVAAGGAGHPTFSQMYTTGTVTGVFFFGDFYQYQSKPPMRTVIIVQ